MGGKVDWVDYTPDSNSPKVSEVLASINVQIGKCTDALADVQVQVDYCGPEDGGTHNEQVGHADRASAYSQLETGLQSLTDAYQNLLAAVETSELSHGGGGDTGFII